MNPVSIATRASLALLALCSTAHARDHTRLVVTRQKSAAECPDERALSDAVGARLGYEPFAPSAASLVVVTFRRDGATLLATVQLQDAAGKVQGERTLSSAKGDCEELAATTALTISILLDPRSAIVPSSPPEPEPKPEPEPTPARSLPPSSATEPPAKHAPTPSTAPPFRPPLTAAASDELPKEGGSSSGISVFPVALGAIQAFSAGGHGFGLRFGVGVQIELGPRWALRLPLVIAVASGGSSADYAELAVIPGVIYRFRRRATESFTPYVGAGAKFGGFGAQRALLGKPPVAGTSIQGLFDGHDYFDDPNFESTLSVGGEVSIGGSWHASRRLSLDFELSAGLVPVAGVLVEVVAETAAARFTL